MAMIMSTRASLRDDQDAHPVLLKLFANRRIVYPSRCMAAACRKAPAAAQARLQDALLQGGVP